MTAAILNLQRDRGFKKGARMERLTFVTEDGEVLFHPEDFPDDEGVTITQLAVARRFRALETIAERLANREQAEEQGLILRLPCKVGDNIFLDFAGFGKDIDEFTVKDFHLDCFEDGETILYCDYESNDGIFSGQIDVMKFGKTVFLTRGEAEAKLAEMEGAE